MKNILSLLVLSSFFITGCFSSNYTVQDFKSKEDFNKSFNDFAKNKELELTFKNGANIPIETGSKIINDSLTFKTDETQMAFALSDIEQITYSSLDNKRADIILKNGEKLKALNIKTYPDSIKFMAARSLPSVNTVALNKINEASHEDNWLGIWGSMGLTFAALGVLAATKVFPYTKHGNDTEETFEGQGMLLGIPAGIGWGIITAVALVIVIRPTIQGGNPPYHDDFDYGTLIFGIPIAAILGAITGWFIGHNFNYHFN